MAGAKPVANIKLTFEKMMEIRRKRWCWKYKKVDVKIPSGGIIKIETAVGSVNNIVSKADDITKVDAPVLADSKEDVIIKEEKQKNDDGIVADGDSVDCQTGSREEAENKETIGSSQEENQITTIENHMKEENLDLSKPDLNEDVAKEIILSSTLQDVGNDGDKTKDLLEKDHNVTDLVGTNIDSNNSNGNSNDCSLDVIIPSSNNNNNYIDYSSDIIPSNNDNNDNYIDFSSDVNSPSSNNNNDGNYIDYSSDISSNILPAEQKIITSKKRKSLWATCPTVTVSDTLQDVGNDEDKTIIYCKKTKNLLEKDPDATDLVGVNIDTNNNGNSNDCSSDVVIPSSNNNNNNSNGDYIDYSSDIVIPSKVPPTEQKIVTSKRRKSCSATCSTVTVSDTLETPVNGPNNSEGIVVGALPIEPIPKKRNSRQRFNKNEDYKKRLRNKKSHRSLMVPALCRKDYSASSENRTPQHSRNWTLGNNNNTDGFISNEQVDRNIFNVRKLNRVGLREIIIDGSNVALSRTMGKVFSVKAIEIAIDCFLSYGHKVITFVPQYRVKRGFSSNPRRLMELHEKNLVIFTPSREVDGIRITPYDDRYIIQYARSREGIIVSNDNFRDLLIEKPHWRETIKRRILMYTWVGDTLMLPEDPLGRYGPKLNEFLSFP